MDEILEYGLGFMMASLITAVCIGVLFLVKTLYVAGNALLVDNIALAIIVEVSDSIESGISTRADWNKLVTILDAYPDITASSDVLFVHLKSSVLSDCRLSGLLSILQKTVDDEMVKNGYCKNEMLCSIGIIGAVKSALGGN